MASGHQRSPIPAKAYPGQPISDSVSPLARSEEKLIPLHQPNRPRKGEETECKFDIPVLGIAARPAGAQSSPAQPAQSTRTQPFDCTCLETLYALLGRSPHFHLHVKQPLLGLLLLFSYISSATCPNPRLCPPFLSQNQLLHLDARTIFSACQSLL